MLVRFLVGPLSLGAVEKWKSQTRALVNRGVLWGQQGETAKEIADYTRVIEDLPGAPAEQVAEAYGHRGWASYEKSSFDEFLLDTRASIGASIAPYAVYNLGLALLACNRDAEALGAYEKAITQFPNDIEELGLADLEAAQKSWLSAERAAPIVAMLRAAIGRERTAG